MPADRVFVRLDAYKQAIDCGVDLVVMATSPGFRPMHYAYAVQQGKHVFMEKPCCTDAPGYRSLVESNKLADQKKLNVVVGLQRHHQAGYLQGVKEIHDGKLGDVVCLRVYWNGLGGGARELGSGPQNDPKEMEFQVRHWGCFRGNYGDIFDHHAVAFSFADGTKMFSQSRHIEHTWDQGNEFVHGTKGSRSVHTGGGPKLESGNPYDQEHIDLVKAILADTPLHEGWFGAVSSMTAVLGRMATYSGQVVKWDDAVAKGPREAPEHIAWDAKPRSLPGPDGFYPFPMPGTYKPY